MWDRAGQIIGQIVLLDTTCLMNFNYMHNELLYLQNPSIFRGNCVNKTKSFFHSLLSESGHKKLKSTIQRSTETGMAAEMRKMVRQPSRESTDGSINSYSSEGK